MRALIVLLMAAGLARPAIAEDLPEDAQREIQSFEKKKQENEAKAAAAMDKEREKLVKELNKAIDRETKARHSAQALAIKEYVEGLAAAKAEAAPKKTDERKKEEGKKEEGKAP